MQKEAYVTLNEWNNLVSIIHMPNLYAKLDSNDIVPLREHVYFWGRQWRKHGQPSGMTFVDYFTTIVDLFKKVPKYHGMT